MDAVAILTSVITLLLGAVVTKLFSDKKLEKLGVELKNEIKKATTPLGEMSKSVLELDKKVVQLIERFSAQNDDLDEQRKQIEELFNRVRTVETIAEVNKQKLYDITDNCKRHKE